MTTRDKEAEKGSLGMSHVPTVWISESEYQVGVFEHERRSGRVFLMAYVRYFNPQWEGCCLHLVTSANGTEAKEVAKAEHRRVCMSDRPAHQREGMER